MRGEVHITQSEVTIDCLSPQWAGFIVWLSSRRIETLDYASYRCAMHILVIWVICRSQKRIPTSNYVTC